MFFLRLRSYRFVELFPHATMVRDAQKQLDELIQQGVFQITRLLKNSEAAASNAQDVDSYALSQKRSVTFYRGIFI